MRCPHCDNDSIPFLSVYLRFCLGSFRCSRCGGFSKARLSIMLTSITGLMGMACGALGFYKGWAVFGVAAAVAVVVDACLDYFFRKLEPVARFSPTKSPSSSTPKL